MAHIIAGENMRVTCFGCRSVIGYGPHDVKPAHQRSLYEVDALVLTKPGVLTWPFIVCPSCNAAVTVA